MLTDTADPEVAMPRLSLLLLPLLLAACTATVRSPDVELRTAPVKVVVGGGGGGGFCPPGQAKKGVC